MKEILLSQGLKTIVDEEDYTTLSQYKWFANRARYTFYAARNINENGKKTVVRMHRIIMSAEDDQQIDRINGDGLDNRRSNLRVASVISNQQNRTKHSGNFIYKGISFRSDILKHWRARITVNKQEIVLGYFETSLEAALAYDDAAKRFFGEFARTNADLGLVQND
jgi:hypothetical protein